MIQLLQQGTYKLIETKGQNKVLTLSSDEEKQVFAWIHAQDIGEILVTSHRKHSADYILATGKYRLYLVENEPKLTDLEHLELLAGEGVWQGYLLPNGLPTDVKIRRRIVPTQEIITKSTFTKIPAGGSGKTL